LKIRGTRSKAKEEHGGEAVTPESKKIKVKLRHRGERKPPPLERDMSITFAELTEKVLQARREAFEEAARIVEEEIKIVKRATPEGCTPLDYHLDEVWEKLRQKAREVGE
jgi:hypothetical protein